MNKPGFVKMITGECKSAPVAGSRDHHPVIETRGTRVHANRFAWLVILAFTLAASDAPRAEPLAGRIWAPDAARFVAPDEVMAAARAAHFVLLGETHTLARHHDLQAHLIRAIAADGRKPPVVFEMIARDRQTDIDAWRRAPEPDAEAFGDAVQWRESGWPPWSEYRPIAEAALTHGLPIRAGGPAAELSRRVATEGLGAIAENGDSPLTGLATPLDATAERRLLDTLERAHCGLPEHAPIDRMIAIQRLRDASMAHTMISGDSGDGAILIAGRGHVRRDYGVPVYLHRGAPERDVVTIGFVGTDSRPRLTDHREAAGGTLAFDYVWFTQGGAAGPDCSATQ